MFQGGVTLLPGTEHWPVSFNKRQQNEEALFQNHSWCMQASPRETLGKHARVMNVSGKMLFRFVDVY